MRVRKRQLDLDAELASGADTSRSEELALRASQLAGRKSRERQATAIEKLIASLISALERR